MSLAGGDFVDGKNWHPACYLQYCCENCKVSSVRASIQFRARRLKGGRGLLGLWTRRVSLALQGTLLELWGPSEPHPFRVLVLESLKRTTTHQFQRYGICCTPELVAEMSAQDAAARGVDSLALLGVVAIPEQELEQQIIARAKTRSATGVSTTASLTAVIAVQAKNAAALALLPTTASSAAVKSSEFSVSQRDRLRMRSQLLQRLLQIRKAEAAASAAATVVELGGREGTADLGASVLASLEATGLPTALPLQRADRALGSSHSQATAATQTRRPSSPQTRNSSTLTLECPVCQRQCQAADIERHVDRCLRRSATASGGEGSNQALGTAAPEQSPLLDEDDRDFDREDDAGGPDDRPRNSARPAFSRAPKERESGGGGSQSIWQPATSGNKSRRPRVSPSSTVDNSAHASGRLSRKEIRSRVVDDDWDDGLYAERVEAARVEEAEEDEGGEGDEPLAATRAPDDRMVALPNGLALPRRIHRALLPYQVTGVQWLWALHRRGLGGVLGDEMVRGSTKGHAFFLLNDDSPPLDFCRVLARRCKSLRSLVHCMPWD